MKKFYFTRVPINIKMTIIEININIAWKNHWGKNLQHGFFLYLWGR